MATSAAGIPPPGSIRPAAARPGARVGTEEFHSAALPAAQEAAVLYAGNHGEAAAALLRHEIKDPVGRNNKQAWLMLFDLYQAAQNRAEFDSLSMLFTVKFEQSPPAWSDSAEGGADPRRQQSRERKDFFALKPSAQGEIAGEIEKFAAFAQGQGTVRLDVGKVTAFTPEEAALLLSALRKLRRQQTPMWFNSLEAFEKVLRDAMNERSAEDAKPYWELLFELFILQGKMAEFEDLGLEFAVAFEMSPPSWEAYVNTVAEAVKAQVPARAEPAGRAEPESGFALKGVLSTASTQQMADLSAHAASQTEVVVDMSRLLRIDFAFTSAFFETVKALQLAGKRVILANLNELNAALLEALGVNRYAILVRRKST
ncbi:MAG TPA: STAS domain-containing protein [Usitatibacter sp.]|jgi:anti-anti-sigma regulatory factor|nr:STAS domain-containing protein [Usitatibacter sp.]